jgi:hypothetical protein
MIDLVPSRDYHSQLTQPVAAAPAGRFTLGDSVAFQHDITDGLPAEYEDCDVLYSELPWQNGMAVFNERAGRDVSYQDFCQAIGQIAVTTELPMILVTGKHGKLCRSA